MAIHVAGSESDTKDEAIQESANADEALSQAARKQGRKPRQTTGGGRVVVSKGAVSDAAKNGNHAELLRILAEADKIGEDVNKMVNEKDRNGSTPLMHVAWPGDGACMRLLLEHGADPLDTNLRRNTPLHFAFERGHVEVARLLIDNGGAKALNMKNALGKTPLDLNPVMKFQLRL